MKNELRDIQGSIDDQARDRAARLITEIFRRVGQYSPAGLALSRALGMRGGPELSGAAQAFSVSEEYLLQLQDLLERQIGDLGGFAIRDKPVSSRNISPGR